MMESSLAISQAKYWHLRQVALFEGLAANEVRRLGDLVETELIEAGKQIYRVGDIADRVYVLKSGKVKISKSTEDGKEFILYFVRPGELFGELAIAGNGVRTGTAAVVEDAFVCTIGRDHFEPFLFRNPAVTLEISRIIGRRKERAERRILDLATKDVRTRLAHTLAELCEEFGVEAEVGIRIDLKLTQGELAQLVGSTRETTSTLFNEFRRQGLVTSEGRTIDVLDPQALGEYAWVPKVEHSVAA